jgi:hypothetical protein
MNGSTGKKWFRGVSLLVLFTFLSSTIAWSYPKPVESMDLAAQMTFQSDVMDSEGEAFLAAVREDIRFHAAISAIADFIREYDDKAIKYLPETLSREIPSLPEGIALNNIKEENGIISVYFRKEGLRGIIHIAEKDSGAAARMEGAELPCSSDRYRVTVRSVREGGDGRETPIADNDADLPDHKLVNALIHTVVAHQADFPESHVAIADTYYLSGDTVFHLGADGTETDFLEVYDNLPQKLKIAVFDNFRRLCLNEGMTALQADQLFAADLHKLANMSGHAGVGSGNMFICAGVPDPDALLEHEYQERDIHRDMAAGYGGYGNWKIMERTVPADELEDVKRRVISAFRARDDYNQHASVIHNEAMRMAPVGDSARELVPDRALPEGYEIPIAGLQDRNWGLPDHRLVNAVIRMVFDKHGKEGVGNIVKKLKFSLPNPDQEREKRTFTVYFLGSGGASNFSSIMGELYRAGKRAGTWDPWDELKELFREECERSGMGPEVARDYVDLTYESHREKLNNVEGHAGVFSGNIYVANYAHRDIDKLIAHLIEEMLSQRKEAAELYGYESWEAILAEPGRDDTEQDARDAVSMFRDDEDYNEIARKLHNLAEMEYRTTGRRAGISNGAVFEGYETPIAGNGHRVAVDRLVKEAVQLVRDGKKAEARNVLLRARRTATDITNEGFRRQTLEEIASAQTDAGLYSEALSTATQERTPLHSALEGIAVAEAKEGFHERARAAAMKGSNRRHVVAALIAIARVQAADNPDEAVASLAEAGRTAERIGHDDLRGDAVRQIEKARQEIFSVKEEAPGKEVGDDVMPELFPDGSGQRKRFDAAVEAARKGSYASAAEQLYEIKGRKARALAFGELSVIFAQDGFYGYANECVTGMLETGKGYPSGAVKSLIGIARIKLSKAESFDEVNRSYRRAMSIFNTYGNRIHEEEVPRLLENFLEELYHALRMKGEVEKAVIVKNDITRLFGRTDLTRGSDEMELSPHGQEAIAGEHDFRPKDAFIAAGIELLVSAVGTGLMLYFLGTEGSYYKMIGYTALIVTVYSTWAAAKAFFLGLDAIQALGGEGVSSEQAAGTPIASRNGYRHPAIARIPEVWAHEGFRSHFGGMMVFLPVIGRLIAAFGRTPRLPHFPAEFREDGYTGELSPAAAERVALIIPEHLHDQARELILDLAVRKQDTVREPYETITRRRQDWEETDIGYKEDLGKELDLFLAERLIMRHPVAFRAFVRYRDRGFAAEDRYFVNPGGSRDVEKRVKKALAGEVHPDTADLLFEILAESRGSTYLEIRSEGSGAGISLLKKSPRLFKYLCASLEKECFIRKLDTLKKTLLEWDPAGLDMDQKGRRRYPFPLSELLIGLEEAVRLSGGTRSDLVRILKDIYRKNDNIKRSPDYTFDLVEAAVKQSRSKHIPLLKELLEEISSPEFDPATKNGRAIELLTGRVSELEKGEGLVRPGKEAVPDADLLSELEELETHVTGSRDAFLRKLNGLIGTDLRTTDPSAAVLDTLREVSGDNFAGDRNALNTLESLRDRKDLFDAEGMIAQVLLLARRAAREDQKLIIGLDTGWIPGTGEGERTFQQGAMTALLRELDKLDRKLGDMGLDNVEFLHLNGPELAGAITEEMRSSGTDPRNVVVLASRRTIEADKDAFSALRGEGDNRAFIAGVDPARLRTFYEEHGESYEKQLNIRLTEMLCMTLEFAAGKKPIGRLTWVEVEYDENSRQVLFIPRPEPLDYENLKAEYRSRLMALQSA